MARIVYATVLVTLLSIVAGCPSAGPYPVPVSERPPTIEIPAGATETDLVEDLVVSRQEYQKTIEQLVGYYTKTGNNMKLEWARKEWNGFMTMPKYNYILGPTPAGQKATTPIPSADNLFYEAQGLEKSAGPVRMVGRDKNKLRLALQRYEQLMKEYPSSDKVDDAAFEAGLILEELGDYMVALDYFKSAFEWDPETIYPARFKAAYILDNQLHRYGEALQLYQEAIKIEARFDRHRQWKEYAEQRVRELQKLGEGQN